MMDANDPVAKIPIGLVLASVFIAVAVVLFALHILAVRTNPTEPGESGESALWFFLLALGLPRFRRRSSTPRGGTGSPTTPGGCSRPATPS